MRIFLALALLGAGLVTVQPDTPTVSALHPLAPSASPAVDGPGEREQRASRSRPPMTKKTGGRALSVTCYVWTGNRTASGRWPRVGMAAGNRWPFGTRLRVENVGTVTVQDRIGHSSELDLFFASRAACIKFGRKRLLVEVLR